MSSIAFFKETELHGVFSNFYTKLEPLVHDGKQFATSEHLYQYCKFAYKGASAATLAYAEKVRTAKTPNQSRLLAKQTTGGGYAWRTALNPAITESLANGVKPDPKWEIVKRDHMRLALRLKFAQPVLRAQLAATGKARLYENSPYDDYWGVGKHGSGANWLGKLLMELREEIAASDCKPTGLQRNPKRERSDTQ